MKKCMLVFVWWFFFGQITQQAPKNCPLWATNKWNKAASKKALTTARQALYASNRNELMPWLAPRTSTWNCTKRRRLLQSGGRNCTLNITLKRWDVQLQTKQESVYIYIYKTEIQMASYRLKSQNDAPVCNERKASRHVYLKIKTIL